MGAIQLRIAPVFIIMNVNDNFYSLWEELSNDNFKLAEFREFKNDSSTQSFTMSPSRWIKETNAKGFISKRGKYDGGTFAHPDIALEFASVK